MKISVVPWMKVSIQHLKGTRMSIGRGERETSQDLSASNCKKTHKNLVDACLRDRLRQNPSRQSMSSIGSALAGREEGVICETKSAKLLSWIGPGKNGRHRCKLQLIDCRKHSGLSCELRIYTRHSFCKRSGL